ncbi:rRNA maturation RNase YbeY [Candidatus Methylomirabilis sp.]|uniref:rRNA maturation RNase YbeY n=1 Tax=Candidatus Methylomirabilis sp. TaxID=2032687 RepID=UPI002A633043|nr:rRNA maturation RNase YbeY [Candidatus Methylomirabilis sp.]
MALQVINRQRKIRLDTRFLKKVGQTTLVTAGAHEAECGLLLVSDRAMTRLNRQYRGIAKSTDVLSFPMREGPLASLSPNLLGDVVISAEMADRQATAAGRSLRDELVALLIHGILHLLGYDHQTPSEAKRMKRLERQFGLPFIETEGG